MPFWAFFQGSVIPVEQSLAARMHTPVSDVNSNEQTSVSTVPVIPMQTPTTKAGSIVTNYKKPYALSRRSYNTPTILVKHGHKVQRVMVSSTNPATMYNGQVLNPSETCEDGYVRYTSIPNHSTSNWTVDWKTKTPTTLKKKKKKNNNKARSPHLPHWHWGKDVQVN